MGKPTLECTLFYANWCGHCVNAKKEWEILQNKVSNIQDEFKNVKIIVNKFEEAESNKLKNSQINGKNIDGYPTIRFKLTSGKDTKDYEYDKERKADILEIYIRRICTRLEKKAATNDAKKDAKKDLKGGQKGGKKGAKKIEKKIS